MGDFVKDMEAAKAAGVETVAVLSGGAYSESELRVAGAAAVFRHCAEPLESDLPRWVEGPSEGNEGGDSAIRSRRRAVGRTEV